MTKTSSKKPKKPKIMRERLQWKLSRGNTRWDPYHRATWTDSSGQRKERSIKLNWLGDLQRLDEEY